ncbi:putative pisatin demethylase protein [Neofusicoccum parvum UCRNP2]|uniref:Putative pisatin demethylase protein n=1 Tax=Botryosphaeria parva (strain UCR-NP2) TaxID=1287680 RepID=R1E7M8_BOTPV|nr:putative pisatin demethylase protein [Neofusicoccum parvum UCRNP2]
MNAGTSIERRPIVRIAPGEYSLSDPAAVKPIYGHGTAFIKSPYYDATRNPDAPIADLFSERDPKAHAAFRKKVAGLYSMTSMLKIDDSMQECIEVLLGKFEEFARTGEAVDLQRWLQCYTFDVMGAVTIAARFGFLDAGEDQFDLLHSSHASLIYLTHVGIYPELHRALFALVKRLGKNGMKGLFDASARQIEAGRSGKLPGDRDGFLARMLRLHEADPANFSYIDMLIICATNVAAGSDSTSIALTAILWYLIKSPSVMEKTVLGMNPWVVHLNKEVFGEDAEVFRPERWLGDKEKVSNMEKHLLTFGAGARGCLGKNIGMIELSTLIPDLLRNFDFELVEKDAGLQTQNIFFVKQKDLRVHITRREL